MKYKILVTGASGFVGSALCANLSKKGYPVRATVRSKAKLTTLSDGFESISVGNIDGATNWLSALADVNCVIHAAARVHIMADSVSDPLAEFRKINVEGTLNVARQAAQAGVQRFVFISTIGVNGAETFSASFNVKDKVAPHSPYAVSKYEAELGLQALASQTGMDVVIIRPPLVYGPKAPGNFDSLMRWLQRGLPLPLGSIDNRRSFVALDNLIDLILLCLIHPAAANQTFMVSDGEDISTTELLRRMSHAMGRPARLLPVPASLLRVAATVLGKADMVQSLCGSLQVDIEKTRQLLDWSPPVTMAEQLREMKEYDARI